MSTVHYREKTRENLCGVESDSFTMDINQSDCEACHRAYVENLNQREWIHYRGLPHTEEDGKEFNNITSCVKTVTCPICVRMIQAEQSIQIMFKEGHYPRCSVCRAFLDPGNYFTSEDAGGKRGTVKWTCKNHPGIYWSTEGDLYSDYRGDKEAYMKVKDYQYIDGLSSAFGTFARQLEVEIYKHDEDKYIKLWGGWTMKLRAKYESNYFGDILKRRWKIEWIKDNIYQILNLPYFLKSLWGMLMEIVRYQFTRKSLEELHSNCPEVWVNNRFHMSTAPNHRKWGFRWTKEVGIFLSRFAGIRDVTPYLSWGEKRDAKRRSKCTK